MTAERIRKTKDVKIFGKDLDFRERLSSSSVEPFNVNKQFTSLPGNGEYLFTYLIQVGYMLFDVRIGQTPLIKTPSQWVKQVPRHKHIKLQRA